MKMRILPAYIFGVPGGVAIFWLFFYFDILDSLKIIFYRGLFIVSVVCVVQIVLLLIYISRGARNLLGNAVPHAISIAMLCLTINFGFFIVFPVSLDRSVSVFLLGYMAEVDRPVTKKDLERAFNDIYVVRYGAIDRRIEEQIASGNLIETGAGTYRLTNNGLNFIKLSQLTANVFHISDRFIRPIPDEN